MIPHHSCTTITPGFADSSMSPKPRPGTVVPSARSHSTSHTPEAQGLEQWRARLVAERANRGPAAARNARRASMVRNEGGQCTAVYL